MNTSGQKVQNVSLTQTPITDYTCDQWQTVKKRKINETSPPRRNQPGTESANKVKNHTLAVSNRFGVLDDVSQSESSNEAVIQADIANAKDGNTTERKKTPPPPIFVQSVNDYKGMLDRITQTIPKEHFVTKGIANDAVRININEVDSYRKLIKEFRARDIKFFTYQIKAERAFKVVVRNLHHSIKPEDIKQELQEKGFSVRNVVNIRHSRTKNPLPLFFVDLDPVGEFKSIYEVKALLQHRVTIESPRPRREIVQCMRCQKFGHTRSYCTLPPVCVKCGQEHDNRACTKGPEVAPTCGLCNGNHTANYRGCPEYLKIKNPPRTSRIHPTGSSATQQQHIQPKSQNVPYLTQSYARIASTDTKDSTTGPMPRMEQLIVKMCSQLEMMISQNMKIFDLLTRLVTKLI